jgi:nucleoside-diphosphate-sugar epimerase
MIFLIGGSGFVGSGFARILAELGRPHVILQRHNYRDYIGQRCDILINANGNSRKPLAKQAPLEDFDQSVRSVRASLADFHFNLYLHLSSCDVYPDCSSPPTTAETLPLDPAAQSPYGFHKFLAEQCVRHAASQWLIFRCGGFVGPGMKKNAIFDILQGGPLWLDPESELQFLHTSAAARIALTLAERGVRNEVFNLCGSGVVKLREVAEASGKQVAVTPGSPRVRYDVSIAKLARHIDVPDTRGTVLDFIGLWTNRK